MVKIENRIHLEAHYGESLFVHVSSFDDRTDVRVTIGTAERTNDAHNIETLEEQAINTIILTAAEAFKLSEFLQGAGSQAADVGCRQRELEMQNVYRVKPS